MKLEQKMKPQNAMNEFPANVFGALVRVRVRVRVGDNHAALRVFILLAPTSILSRKARIGLA